MRFTSLRMCPFGTFTDFELTFSQDTGLHLVYGTNGAGKSTTLEALRSVLYGMAQRRKVHAAAELRIGARIERENGDSLDYLRRTSPKTPLWNATDDAPIPTEELTPFLGNIERDRFEMLFGLDHETMVQGGRDLLEGKGEIGRALFGAMLGGTRLRHVSERLDTDLRSLYASRSSKGRINELVKEHKALTKDLKQASIKPTSHREDQKRLKAAQAENEALTKERGAARKRVDELASLRRSAVALDQLESRRAERASLGQLQPLDEAKAKRVTDLAKEREALGARADERAKEIHGLKDVIAEATALATPGIIEALPAIEALNERRSAYREGVDALKELQRQLDEARGQRRAQGVGQEDAGSDALPSNIDELSERAEQLSEQLTSADRARALSHGAVCDAEPKTQGAAERLESIDDWVGAKLADRLVELAPFSGTPLELKALQVPAKSELQRRGAEELEHAAALRELRQDLARTEAELRSIQEALQRLAETEKGAPPTLAEVQAARQHRDGLIQRAFDEPTKKPSSALDVAQAVHVADELADRRARDSVAAAEREAKEGLLQRTQSRVKELAAAEAAALATQSQSHAAWAKSLRALGLGDGFAAMDAAALTEWCAERAAVLQAAQSLRDEAEDSLARAKADEAKHRAQLKAAEGELQLVNDEWRSWAKARSLDPDAGPKVALGRLRKLKDVQSADRDLTRLELELDRRTGAVKGFEQDVLELCDRLKLHPEDTSAEVRMGVLIDAARQTTKAQSALEADGRRLSAAESQRKLSAERAAEIDSTLQTFIDEAGCQTREELMRLASQSERARGLDADIERTLDELRSEHGNRFEESKLREAIGERTAGELSSALEAAQDAAQALDAAITERALEEGSLRARVESTGSADAARIQSRLAEVETELADATAEFMKVHLAQELLKREIERNRQETHGPLLKRAQGLFEILTLGAYERLHPSETSGGKEVMVARRPSGRQVGVGEMSSGTRDQLYLALRIATVEQMIKTVEPMPFIADDLFVNFDDERTRAALKVLAELSKSTQVIVFSHHRSVVSTARALSEDGVTVDVLELVDERSREAAD